MYEECWVELAAAICEQARTDYASACVSAAAKVPEDISTNDKLKKAYHASRRRARGLETMEEIESFWKSDWFELLSGFEGEHLCSGRNLRREIYRESERTSELSKEMVRRGMRDRCFNG